MRCNHPGCKNEQVGIFTCEEHNYCRRCFAKPPVERYYADGYWWCAECWPKEVERLIAENEKKPAETYNQALAVCPWCGYTERDSWEFEDGEQLCGRCNREYELEIIVSRDYTTKKKTTNRGIRAAGIRDPYDGSMITVDKLREANRADH